MADNNGVMLCCQQRFNDDIMNTNKERILAAASELLLEKGLSGLSVRAISQRAGLSTIAIYSHFQGKEGVIDALYIDGFNAVYRAVDETGELATPQEAALRASQNYLNLAQEHEARYRLIFGESDSHYQPSDDARKSARRAFNRLVDRVSELFPKDSPRREHQQAALRIWAVIHGFVSLRQHVIGEILDYESWRAMVLSAVADDLARIAQRALPQE